MKGYIGNIEEATIKNENFRQVLYTGQHAQLVVMSLPPHESIGLETHEVVDQFFRIEKGTGEILLGGETYPLKDGDAIIVPAGVAHNVTNTSSQERLQIYTIYSPAHHKDQVVHKTKAIAEADESDHI